MSTITKERVKDILNFGAGRIISPITDDEIMDLARIALASLDVEPIYQLWDEGYYDTQKETYDAVLNAVGTGVRGRIVYTAPPAPANAEPVAWLWSHRKRPNEVTLVRPEDDERAECAHWSGWSCQALYAAQPASAAMKDHQIRELVNELRDIAVEYHGTQQLRERIARTVRAAMLQRGENSESPTTLNTATALDSLPKIAESTSGNSPVIPDGWKLVPVELTGAMTNAMTDAILDDLHNVDVWRSVLAAAPQQEV